MTEGLQFIIENRNRGFLTPFSILWLLAWCAMTGTMLYALFFDNNGRYSLLFNILAVLFLVGYFVWRKLLWSVRGKHVVEFHENHLSIYKVGTLPLGPAKRVSYRELSRFATTKSRESGFSGQLWGNGGETIAGMCINRHFYVGAGWDLEDAEEMVDKLNHALKVNK